MKEGKGGIASGSEEPQLGRERNGGFRRVAPKSSHTQSVTFATDLRNG